MAENGGRPKGRIIFHIDMNSFFASVEQAHDPSLKGKPVAIAGNPKERRGIVVTCSYEARAHGVYTTMPVWEARKKCPDLIVIPPDHNRYRDASNAMFGLLGTFTELVEPVSIDEGYLDVTETDWPGSAVSLAEEIQRRVLAELDLPCSIGIAPNKFLAKTASDMKKPMGITILRKRDVPSVLWPLPVIEMHGVGKSTEEKLNSIEIRTIGELAAAHDGLLKENLGKRGLYLKARANGIDGRPVDPESANERKSVGGSVTLPVDETDPDEMKKTLRMLAGKVALRLARRELAGDVVTLQIRDADWVNHSRSRTLTNPVFSEEAIFREAEALLDRHWEGQPVRLLGVTVGRVVDRSEATEQLSIFSYEKYAREEPVLKALGELEQKFGKGAVTRGIRGAGPDGK
ncbi:DNA polymerase IV [Edaphobacillus lindanitolerans]|uniref:DNA polymerase IV n=1 Tax=Edaphobacillus lindanitolerans TaxID=550447 RepID=A0A1U7PPR3_9BACI|nr:DNA polymerase IV [Edaphobacillus lindanitolerans]SIT81399.1 DNA polymerase-4 [Edaphobacillus lindanitolerans]